MLFRTSIVYGFIRLCLLVFFVFYANKKLFSRFKNQNFLDFIVIKWFKYGTILLILVFFMIQLGVYNFLNLLFLLSIWLLFEYIGIENLKHPKRLLTEKINIQALSFLKNIENKKKFSNWLRLDKENNLQKTDIQLIATLAALVSMQFFIEYYIFNFDIFSFSKLWNANLSDIIHLDSQLWFTHENSTLGQSAFIDMYSKTVNVSPEVALQSISILEDILLNIIIFWTVYHISNFKFIAAVLASLFFTLAHTIIPVNIEFVLKNNSIFSALTLAIPLMVFMLKPSILQLKKHHFFVLSTLCFIAIGLINLVVLLVIFPMFLILMLVLNFQKEFEKFWFNMVSFLLGTTILLLIYAISCWYLCTDFMFFIHSNLISTHTFTYLPNLSFSYPKLILMYQISSGLGIIGMVFLQIFKKENWKTSLALMLLFNGIILLTYLNSNWLDTDLIISIIPVFLPITIGLNVALLIRFFAFKSEFSTKNKFVLNGISIVVFLLILFFIQKESLQKLKTTDRTPTTVLNAYDQISRSYIPYSYAVVNVNSAELISTNKHFFISYDYFINNYKYRDSIFNAHKKDPHFFVKNPKMVLPNSIFVFVYNDLTKNNPTDKSKISHHYVLDINDPESLFSEGSRNAQKVQTIIDDLKQKGRDVNLYFSSKEVSVFELINVPKKSKIEDLIYEK